MNTWYDVMYLMIEYSSIDVSKVAKVLLAGGFGRDSTTRVGNLPTIVLLPSTIATSFATLVYLVVVILISQCGINRKYLELVLDMCVHQG